MAKTDKICIICGKTFQGTAKAQVCGATCRQRLKRGAKPTFKLVAEKKKKETPEIPKLKFSKAKAKDLDGSKTETLIMDEIGCMPRTIPENRYLSERWKMKMGIK